MARAVEQAAALHRLVERLPEADQHIILARFWDEQSLRDIGAALGLSEDAAQKRLSRALEKLRVQLGVPRGKQMAVALGAWLGVGVSSQAAQVAAVASGSTIPSILLMTTTTQKTVGWAIDLPPEVRRIINVVLVAVG